LWDKHLWSPSYCAVSCGKTPQDVIKHYIQNQQEPTSQKSIQKSIALTGKKKASFDPPLKEAGLCFVQVQIGPANRRIVP
jgi:hypothetical protein